MSGFLSTARVVLRKELRETLRDPLVLVNAFAFPFILLPLILWGTTQFALLQAGAAEQDPPRVALAETDALPDGLRDALLAEPVERADDPGAADVDRALRAGELDARVRFARDGDAWTLHIAHDSTRQRSVRARRLLVERVGERGEIRLAELAAERGLEPAKVAPRPIEIEDISKADERWSELLSEMLPVIIFAALMMAVIFPAVDTVAGERERGTVETTLVTAIHPAQVALGKIAAVVFIGLCAMTGNALAVGLTVVQFMITLGAGDVGALGFSATSILLAAPALLAATVALVAATVVAVLPTQSFKEGQQRASYVLIAGMVAAVIAQRDPAPLDAIGALNPLTSPVALIRDAIRGTLEVTPALIALATHVACAIALLAFAARKLRDESYLLGGPARGRRDDAPPQEETR